MGRSRELPLASYRTDKIANGYLDYYDPVMAPLVHEPITLLELGVQTGASLLLWRDYFPHAHIVGVDRRLPPAFRHQERIHLYQCNQVDTTALSRIARDVAPGGFDVVIDDASHLASATRASFWHLFDHHLKPGGWYVIEDWGTGYWSDWPDGREAQVARARPLDRARRWLRGLKQPVQSHLYGMVGFVKELLDEQGATDRTRRNLRQPPGRPSKFHSMLVTPSLVFVQKRAQPVSDVDSANQ